MRLKSLTFEDKRTGWKLEDLRLDRFNLLVGASGVGKTRILRALRVLQTVGLVGNVGSLEQAFRFDARFEHEGQSYRWRLDSTDRWLEPGEDEGSALPPPDRDFVVLEESLYNDEEGPLIERDQERFLFRGKELPLLARSVSALKLLDEPSIQGLRRGFAEHFLGMLEEPGVRTSVLNPELRLKRYPTLESLRSHAGLHPVLKAFALQENFPAQFDRVKQLFIDIFPSVEDVVVDRRDPQGSTLIRALLSFKLKERGVPSWIEASDISSGMARTLVHLVNLTVAPAGTVVLIDEFENSLGVNCMGPLTDFILSRANDLQFIITSHHPYIINNIPKSYWKIVRRKGSTVRVTPASEIPALQGPSAQDDFIRLINSPEFEEGME
jgi:predicted ATPase